MYPGTLLAIQAIIGTIWWILLLFVFVKNDVDLTDSTGTAQVPLVWMWSGMAGIEGGWTGASYVSSFVVYLVVSVLELVSWFMYLGGDSAWFASWVEGVGWYGSVIFMMLPPLFALFQLTFPTSFGGLAGNYAQNFGYNSIF